MGVTELMDEIEMGRTGLLPGTRARFTEPLGKAAGAL